MRKLLIIGLCLFAVACGPTKPKDMVLGGHVHAAIGAVNFCKRHADDEKCVPPPVVYKVQP